MRTPQLQINVPAPTFSPTFETTFVMTPQPFPCMENGFTNADIGFSDSVFTPGFFFVETVVSCGAASAATSKGVWYQITGDGTLILVRTCSSDFDTQIIVWERDCSNSPLICVDGNDDSSDVCGVGSDKAAVEWFGVFGETYSIFVCELLPMVLQNATMTNCLPTRTRLLLLLLRLFRWVSRRGRDRCDRIFCR